VPAPAAEAEGAVNTVYVGTLMSPTKPLVEVTGPEKVVEAIYESSHASFSALSACRQSGLSAHVFVPENLFSHV
jgi:hypothetical protein